MVRIAVVILVLGSLVGCSGSDVDRCVDAHMRAFDEKNPSGVTVLGKTRAQHEAAVTDRCLYLSKGRR